MNCLLKNLMRVGSVGGLLLGLMGCNTSSNSFTATPLSSDSNTVLLMHFDEANNSQSTADSSTNALTGSLLNQNTVTGSQLLATWEIPGYVLNSLSLMTMGEYVSVPNNAALNVTGDLTIEMWVHPSMTTLTMFGLNSQDPGIMLISKRTGVSSQQPYTFGLKNNGAIYFEAYYTGAGAVKGVNTSVASTCATTSTPVQLNFWQHLAVTRTLNSSTNSVEVKIFYNGNKICDFTDSTPWGTAASNSENLLIGYDNFFATNTSISSGGSNNFSFLGQIDELRVENTALSEAQIQADWAAASH